MSSIINAGKDLLNILPPAALSFGKGYGLVSGLHYFGRAQSLNPLMPATISASLEIVEGLMDLTCKNITSLQHIHQLRNQEKEIDNKLKKHQINPMFVELSLVDKNSQEPKILQLINRKEELGAQLFRYKIIFMVAQFAVLYFSETTTALVSSALTSAVTYLPGSALTISSSLSITPIGLIIGTIFLAGLLISKYQERQLQQARSKEIMQHTYDKELDIEKFMQSEELKVLFEEIDSHQKLLASAMNDARELNRLKVALMANSNEDLEHTQTELERIETRLEAYNGKDGHIARHKSFCDAKLRTVFEKYQKADNASKPNIRLLKETIKNEKDPDELKRMQKLIDQHKAQKEAFIKKLEEKVIRIEAADDKKFEELDKLFDEWNELFEEVQNKQEVLKSTCETVKRLYNLKNEEAAKSGEDSPEFQHLNSRWHRFKIQDGRVAQDKKMYKETFNKFSEKANTYLNAYEALEQNAKEEKNMNKSNLIKRFINKHKTDTEALRPKIDQASNREDEIALELADLTKNGIIDSFKTLKI